MRYYKMIAATLIGSATLTSCFKEEPLNNEADIEQAYVHVDNPTGLFFHASDTLVNVLSTENTVTFKIRLGSDCSSLSPFFKLTEGATISPENGSTHDFSDEPVLYTVTSQDKQWQRTYKVMFMEDERTIGDTIKYDFENFKLNEAEVLADAGRYYEWYDTNSKGQEIKNWVSGNEGFALTSEAGPYEFPTVPTEGYDGKGVKLTTLDTGELGAMVGKPLAAGNLFIGKFEGESALLDAMKATQFGKPFDRKPVVFKGMYKYTAGKNFQDESQNIIEGRKDKASIYAVLYKNHDDAGNPVVLYGDNVRTSPQIVAFADIKNVEETDQWTEFETVFDYYQDIDLQVLEDRGYSLAIVFSSSEDGASFRGAVGSTLCIDQVRIICANTEE